MGKGNGKEKWVKGNGAPPCGCYKGDPNAAASLPPRSGADGSCFCECLAVLLVGQPSFCVHSLGERIMVSLVSLRFLAAFSEFWNHDCS